MPYGRLQQGTDTAPNPNGLRVDVHLATLQTHLTAPTGTTLDLQLPAGTLVTETLAERRADTGVGDLEVRLRQSAFGLVARPSLVASLGAVVPTGPYVPRSGAANLAPEASYLTLGRGAAWWLAELDARGRVHPRVTLLGQLAARGPLMRTSDGFAWGSEQRATGGAQIEITPWSALVISTDLQRRGGASEPDPFSTMRLSAANAGGWQWMVSPAISLALPQGLALLVGARIPLAANVRGNQLVPQVGGYLALSYSRALSKPRRPAPVATPALGKITVVDYWAEWCAPCARIERDLAAAAARWPDVRIVKVDATDWPGDSAPTLPAGVTGLPVIELFDETGARVALLVGDSALNIVEKVDALRRAKATQASPKETR